MNQPKQRISSIMTPKRLFLVVGVPIFAYVFALLPSHTAAAASDCSDVFTPLSSYVTNGVNANKSFYTRAMNETGVPWEMLAAIHYRETNFSHTNPSNGQGIFQFVNGDGGPYPPGPVSDDNFYKQLKFMANKLQSDYVWRGSVPRERRKLVANEQNMTIVKDTLFSYNGRAGAYINQAAQYGYNSSTQPYEGSPYVMNRFDCPRARMGIITKDYATGIDSTDTRYGAFTVFARLRGDNFWLLMTRAYSWTQISQEAYYDAGRTRRVDTKMLGEDQKIYMRVKARNIGSKTWNRSGTNPVLFATRHDNNRTSKFCDTSWIACSRPARLVESSVAPGETGTFEFSMTAKNLGNYKEYFGLVAEGKEWFNDIGFYWQMNVLPPTPRWQAGSQQLYADAGRTKPVNVGALKPNTTYYAEVTAKNNGNTTWRNSGANPVRLGTSHPNDRNSAFHDNSWTTRNRAATLVETTVGPGETGTFRFTMTTPASYGTHKEYFQLVSEGKAWFNDIGFHFPIVVAPPTALSKIIEQRVYTNDSKTTPLSTTNIANSSRIYFAIKVRNYGNTTWRNSGANPVHLAISRTSSKTSNFYDSSWVASNRMALLTESTVAPGEVGTFGFWMKLPNKTNGTTMTEYFRPVVEGQMWMNDEGMHQSFVFSTPSSNWEYMGQGAYTDSARTQSANLSNLTRNTTYHLQLRLKNTSGITWKQSNFRLGTSGPPNRTSNFYDSSWLATIRPGKLKETSVSPGGTGTIDFKIRTPNSATVSNEYFTPLIEGNLWLNNIGLYWRFDVK